MGLKAQFTRFPFPQLQAACQPNATHYIWGGGKLRCRAEINFATCWDRMTVEAGIEADVIAPWQKLILS